MNLKKIKAINILKDFNLAFLTLWNILQSRIGQVCVCVCVCVWRGINLLLLKLIEQKRVCTGVCFSIYLQTGDCAIAQHRQIYRQAIAQGSGRQSRRMSRRHYGQIAQTTILKFQKKIEVKGVPKLSFALTRFPCNSNTGHSEIGNQGIVPVKLLQLRSTL